mmetsp:Transcript_52083/g.130845  ORF Transcript_52083/g.130845 Transcript_52083/m.130845 type:complete len:228 (-) Transcript_52083:259-942(-)
MSTDEDTLQSIHHTNRDRGSTEKPFAIPSIHPAGKHTHRHLHKHTGVGAVGSGVGGSHPFSSHSSNQYTGAVPLTHIRESTRPPMSVSHCAKHLSTHTIIPSAAVPTVHTRTTLTQQHATKHTTKHTTTHHTTPKTHCHAVPMHAAASQLPHLTSSHTHREVSESHTEENLLVHLPEHLPVRQAVRRTPHAPPLPGHDGSLIHAITRSRGGGHQRGGRHCRGRQHRR